MKYYYTLFTAALLFTFYNTGHAQTKTSLPNSLWTGFMSDSEGTFDLSTTQEDTVLEDGLTYLKLFYTSGTSAGNPPTYKGGIRFDAATNSIYYNHSSTGGIAKIMYNFNLQVGDTLKKEDGYLLEGPTDVMPAIVVTSIDSIRTNDSIWRKRFFFSGLAAGSVVIEGIGNVGRNLLAVLDRVPTGNDTRFGCYKNNTACIYAIQSCTNCYGTFSGLNQRNIVNNLVRIYPNPAHDVIMVSHPETKATAIELFDASGRLVMSEPLTGTAGQDISIAQLPGGFYYYVVKGTGFAQPGKLLKY